MKQVSTLKAPVRASLVETFARKFGVEPNKMLSTLKATAFKQRVGLSPKAYREL